MSQSICRTKEWISRSKDEYFVIREAETTEFHLPKTAHKDIFWLYEEKRKHVKKEKFVACLKRAMIQRSGTVLAADGTCLNDYCMNPNKKRMPEEKIKGSVAAVINVFDENYYHWLFNVLPRIDMIKRSPWKPKQYLIRNPNIPYIRRMLDILKLENVRVIKPGVSLRCDVLVAAGLPSSPTVDYDICNFIRKELGKGYKPSIRIYSKRAGKRKVINEAEVIKVLQKYDFQIVENERISFDEQVDIYSRAEVIVGVHGANLANTIFAGPRTKILEIHNPNFVGLCYWALSNYAEHDYYYMMAEGKISCNRKEYEWKGNCAQNVKINIDLLKESLTRMGL